MKTILSFVLSSVILFGQATQVPTATGSGTSAGASGAVQMSGGAGTFADSGCTAASNKITCSGGLASGNGSVAGEVQMPELSANGTDYVSWLSADSLAATTRHKIPSTPPSGNQYLTCGTPSSNISTCTWSTDTRGLLFTIGAPDGPALTAASTTTAYISDVPFACTITGYVLSVDAGTVTVKFWKIADGTAIPTSANSINTSGVSLSTGTRVRSSTLTDFTSTSVTAHDMLAMNVTAVATAKFVQGEILCDR